MSTQIRSSGGGRNQKKSIVAGGGGESVSNKKTEIAKAEKEKLQPKPTAEQIRIAEITNINSGSEDPKMREKVATLIEMTQRSEEEVCCALYECDNDLDQAVMFLLETLPVGAFETSSKKKKNRVANVTLDNVDNDWSDANANHDRRDKSRNRSGTRGGRGGTDSRGWRGREARENERNVAESGKNDATYRGGRPRGTSRGGFSGGRAMRGGRIGSRGVGSRDQPRTYSRQPLEEHQEVDTWDNAIAQSAEKKQIHKEEIWGDWDNEEYVGSLKDSKVFTPSNMQTTPLSGNVDLPAPPGLEQHIIGSDPYLITAELVNKYIEIQKTTSRTGSGSGSLNQSQFPEIHSTNASNNIMLGGLDNQHIKSSSTLSAEQSQYFNSLSSQNIAQQQAQANSTPNTSVQYPSSYGAVFGDQSGPSQPIVRRARAKIPPPSKIPASAVEMPGDTLNNIGYLDVQFGGLEFGTDDSFDALTEKFNNTGIDNQINAPAQDVSNEYQSKSTSQQSTLNTGVQNSPIADNLPSGYSQRSSVNVQPQSSVVNSINSSSSNTLEQLSKNDPYIQSNASNKSGYQNSYNSNASTNKAVSYQTSVSGQGVYNSAGYTNVQSSSANTYQSGSGNYAAYNQNAVNSYQQTNAAASNSVSGSNVNSSSTQNIPVGGNSSVNNSNASSNSGYLSSQYQSNQTTSAFPSQQNSYQNNQNVYGSSVLSNNSGYSGSPSTSSSQYSNFSSTKLKDTSTTSSSHFDSGSSVTSSSVVSSSVSSVTSSATTNNSLSSPSLGLTNTKVTNSTAKNSAGLVQPNIQMVSQYIQTGVPYYQQPTAVYSFEDIQMMQQRMPHVQTQYYDLNYQPQTSLGAAGVRDANLGSVAYSTMTDARFARTDNNSSPVSNVSSTISQQPGSSGPMLNVPYAYFYGGNMMPGGFQYGTTAIYPQQMPTANPTSTGQFPKPSYNSGYGSAGSYDALSQASQDYSKGAYSGSGGNQQSKSQNVTNAPPTGSGSDISASMYGKGHVALNKVNSYEKQTFHSGTPPPYNMTGTQATGGASTPFGMYIQQMPATHHNINMPIHQDSNNTGPRQQPGSQNKSGTKQGYSPSYWTGQN